MKITLEAIKALRKRSGAGFTNVKEALEASGGDEEKAMVILREKGMAKGAKRADKAASNGYITSYIHGEGTVGVMIELNCETDFCSKDDKFRELAKNIALHVAATNPEYITVESVPEEIINREKEIGLKEIDPGKPQNIVDKILEGKMQKFYLDNVLTEQKFFKDETKLIKDMVNDVVAALGEKIEIGRICRFQIRGSATYSTL